jgi:hypothetical protein
MPPIPGLAGMPGMPIMPGMPARPAIPGRPALPANAGALGGMMGKLLAAADAMVAAASVSLSSQYRHIWLRLHGPGRVAVQSVSERVEGEHETISANSGATQHQW